MNTHSLECQPHAIRDLSSHDCKAVMIERLMGNAPDAAVMPLLRINPALVYRFDTLAA